jgi:hypothetical protein
VAGNGKPMNESAQPQTSETNPDAEIVSRDKRGS